jgi:cardiolipin synthase
MLDPLADKLMSFAVLISFTTVKLIPLWILIPFLIKELIMIFGAAFLYLRRDNIVIPAKPYGKAGTVFLYISIFSIVLRVPKNISYILLTITLIINLVAFYNYLKISLYSIKNQS